MVDKELKLKIRPVNIESKNYQAQGFLYYYDNNLKKNNLNHNKKKGLIKFNEVEEILKKQNNKNKRNEDFKLIKAKDYNNDNIDLNSYNTFLKNIKISNGNKKKLSTLINQ